MPIYEYRCPACDALTEVLQREPLPAVPCPTATCEWAAERILSVPVIRGELTPYYDEGLGVRIETRQQRAAMMKAENVVEKGTTAMHGAKGTIFSLPGRATDSVPPSGAYRGPRRREDLR